LVRGYNNYKIIPNGVDQQEWIVTTGLTLSVLTRVTLDCSLVSYRVGQYPYGSISTTNTINTR